MRPYRLHHTNPSAFHLHSANWIVHCGLESQEIPKQYKLCRLRRCCGAKTILNIKKKCINKRQSFIFYCFRFPFLLPTHSCRSYYSLCLWDTLCRWKLDGKKLHENPFVHLMSTAWRASNGFMWHFSSTSSSSSCSSSHYFISLVLDFFSLKHFTIFTIDILRCNFAMRSVWHATFICTHVCMCVVELIHIYASNCGFVLRNSISYFPHSINHPLKRSFNSQHIHTLKHICQLN